MIKKGLISVVEDRKHNITLGKLLEKSSKDIHNVLINHFIKRVIPLFFSTDQNSTPVGGGNVSINWFAYCH